ncbi:hypothetical protein [Winogradskyella luteola]|uniref:Uncharacterized protein n=1 Tax=Winogradskyella luteola TaxID=2828330 RepID=A0A9X1F6R2_9FLAO|nr:hypothetical protein [Winogradskyella luteola]MBV7268396.1 hypothetical protein [Winogradskyella luteola]
MKLRLVERTTGRDHNTFPKVSVTSKGTIYINSKAVELMDAKKEPRVSIFQDEEDSQKWFIHLSEHGYIKLKIKDPKKDSSAQLYMSDIAKKITESFHHLGTKSLKFKLLESIEYESKKYYPLEVIKESIEMEIPDPNGRL